MTARERTLTNALHAIRKAGYAASLEDASTVLLECVSVAESALDDTSRKVVKQ